VRSRTEHGPRANRVPHGGRASEAEDGRSRPRVLELAAGSGIRFLWCCIAIATGNAAHKMLTAEIYNRAAHGAESPYRAMRQLPHSRRGPRVGSSHSTSHRDRDKRCDHSLMAHNQCLIVHHVPLMNENTAFGARTHCEPRRVRQRPGSRSGAIATPALNRPKPRSSPVFEAGENDISRNRDPKRVVADEGNLDEHPDDCKPRENKR
jgi:hypothetical protein